MKIQTKLSVQTTRENLRDIVDYLSDVQNRDYFKVTFRGKSGSDYCNVRIEYQHEDGVEGCKKLSGLLNVITRSALEVEKLGRINNPKGDGDLLEKPPSELGLSIRARKCLMRNGIKTIGELVGYSADELLEVKNFGKTGLNEIRTKLSIIGLSLKEDKK